MFSEYFNIKLEDIQKYGAIDISLVADIPMFIDPILIFNSNKKEYKQLHEDIIKYMYFLAEKAKNKLDDKEIKTWFTFKEVCNNWLGFSMSGNKGQALNIGFGKTLYENISFILNNNNISDGIHSEKIMLLYPGNGKDKISDMTVNLIKGYLCKYTEKFTKKYITEKAKKFIVEKVGFNYETGTFTSNKYYLPYVINEKGKEEYVLLTPKDMLRSDEPSINRTDFLKNMDLVRESIDNDSLRIQLNDYLNKAIQEYHAKCENLNKKPKESEENKIKKECFEEFSNNHKEVYDYYVRLKENSKDEIESKSLDEVSIQLKKFDENVKYLADIIDKNKKLFNSSSNSYEEAKTRIEFFKHRIEDNDCYKLFYNDYEQIITTENDLQRMFKFVWHKSIFKDDAETNNGRGPADFVISMGSTDVTVIEFKLAKNTNLDHVFEQVKIYKKANNTEKHIVVIFYFSDREYEKALKSLKETDTENIVNENVFLIDCRIKESASKPTAKA